MSDLSNILREESLTEQFYQELNECDWDAAKDTMKELKAMYVPTYRFEKDLATAMDDENAQSEPEDFTNSQGVEK